MRARVAGATASIAGTTARIAGTTAWHAGMMARVAGMGRKANTAGLLRMRVTSNPDRVLQLSRLAVCEYVGLRPRAGAGGDT